MKFTEDNLHSLLHITNALERKNISQVEVERFKGLMFDTAIAAQFESLSTSQEIDLEGRLKAYFKQNNVSYEDIESSGLLSYILEFYNSIVLVLNK